MTNRKYPTAEIIQKVAAYVRAGAFPREAALAAGVSAQRYEEWMSLNREGKPTALVREFVNAIDEAAAHARVRAEAKVYSADPKTWLKNGPGRETSEASGWTTTAPPCREHSEGANPLEDPAWGRTVARMLEVLKEYPEARAKLARELNEKSEL